MQNEGKIVLTFHILNVLSISTAKKYIYLKIIDRQKTNNVNELQTWPFRRTEVIFIEILCQGKGSFLFEIMCFKTITERKSRLNICPVVSGIVMRLRIVSFIFFSNQTVVTILLCKSDLPV